MADLLRDRTTDVTGTAVQVSGPCSIFVENNSVFNGAEISIEAATNNTTGEFSPVGWVGVITSPGWKDISIRGSYYIRAILNKSGSSTSVSCEVIQ